MSSAPDAAPLQTSPPQLGAVVPASSGARVAARAIDLVLMNLLIALGYVMLVALLALMGDGELPVALTFVVLIAVPVALIKLWFVDLWRRGTTPGMRLLGVAWTRWSRPGAPGVRALVKLLIQCVVSLCTLGLGPVVVYLTTRDDLGRFWFDRVSDIVVIDSRHSGIEPHNQGTPVAAAHPREQAAPPPRDENGLPAAVAPPPEPAAGPAPRPTTTAATTRPEESVGAPGAAEAAPHESATPPEPAAPALETPLSPAPPVTRRSTPAPAAEELITSVPWEQPSAQGSTATSAGSPAARAGAPAGPPAGVTNPSARTPIVVPFATKIGRAAQGTENSTGRAVSQPIALPALHLLLDTGQVVPLEGTVLLGRDPVGVGPWAGSTPVPVVDPERSISKTHLVIRLEETRALVQDLGSTNGTIVVAPDGSMTHATPGAAVDAAVGSTVRFGERSLTVER
ncbi:FHA domain-containing protein [Actinomyces oricola]